MLTERFPELAALDADEQLILARELLEKATTSVKGDVAGELPAELLQKIEARLDAYLANPSSGVSWEHLKTQLRGEPH